MLRKCYGYRGKGGTSAGEVLRQARYSGRRGTPAGEALTDACVRAYARPCTPSIYTRAQASWKLEISWELEMSWKLIKEAKSCFM